jgi:hypothetical protein
LNSFDSLMAKDNRFWSQWSKPDFNNSWMVKKMDFFRPNPAGRERPATPQPQLLAAGVPSLLSTVWSPSLPTSDISSGAEERVGIYLFE